MIRWVTNLWHKIIWDDIDCSTHSNFIASLLNLLTYSFLNCIFLLQSLNDDSLTRSVRKKMTVIDKETHFYDIFTYPKHYIGVITTTIASQITSLTVVYSTVYSDVDQRKHQSSASLAFVWGIHRDPVNSPHKGPFTRKMFPFDDVIMNTWVPGLHCKLCMHTSLEIGLFWVCRCPNICW